jgi:5'-3' exonuclease
MGIQNFSKVFTYTRMVKPKDLMGKTLAVDAMYELMRAALGAKSISTLTDSNGKPTMHISVILANILDFYKNGVSQIWVFDHNQDPTKAFHNPAKLEELAKRRKNREKAANEITTLKDFQKEKPMFSDSEDEDTPAVDKTAERIQALEKRSFKLDSEMIADIKLILDALGIKYTEAPSGFEGEQVCSYFTNIGLADAVYTGDTDPIAYGAKVLLRKNTKDKKIYEYTLDDILAQIAEKSSVENPTIEDIRKIAMILGTDVIMRVNNASTLRKTPGIGAMTVLKKFENVTLTDDQEEGMKEFEKLPNIDEIKIYNDNRLPFEDTDKIKMLIDWLVDVKSFNRSRIQTQFDKALEEDKPKTKVSTKAKPKTKVSTKAKSPVKMPTKRVNGIAGKIKRSSE